MVVNCWVNQDLTYLRLERLVSVLLIVLDTTLTNLIVCEPSALMPL